MAIIHSQGKKVEPGRVANPQVQQALRSWEEKVLLAREEGYAQGIEDAKKHLGDVAEQEAALAEREAVLEQAIAERVAAERDILLQTLGSAVCAFQGLAADVEQLRRDTLASAEAAVVELACALSGRILHHEVSNDPGWLKDLLADALQQVPDRRQVTVRLHPDDLKHIDTYLEELEQRAGLLAHIHLEADGRQRAGGCIIESAGTVIDASVGGSWERLVTELRSIAPKTPLQHASEIPAEAAAHLEQHILSAQADTFAEAKTVTDQSNEAVAGPNEDALSEVSTEESDASRPLP